MTKPYLRLISCEEIDARRWEGWVISLTDSTTALKIFSDRSVVPDGTRYVEMLYPFWGEWPEVSGALDTGRYHRYAEVGRQFFLFSPLVAADISVFPIPWEFVRHGPVPLEVALKFADTSRRAGKPVIIFFWSDSVSPVPIDEAIIFRTSFFQSSRTHREFAMPAWCEDFVEKYLGGQPVVRPKNDRPTIGFCGYAPPPDPAAESLFRRTARWIIRRNHLAWLHPDPDFHGAETAAPLRKRAMHFLSRDSRVNTNFIVRNRFLGGAVDGNGREDIAIGQRVRKEYVDNMVSSDYILCVRGGGNFSYRFYETLCCGRIPVFVDTDCVLPYDFAIDWKQFGVWVKAREVPHIAEKVAAFHEALSPSDFTALQMACRRVWEEWLSPHGFFANFSRHFA